MEALKTLSNDKDYTYEEIDQELLDLNIEDRKLLTNLGPLLGARKELVYSSNPVLKGSLSLRECNLLYRESGGCKTKKEYFAEFDRCTTKGSISPLRRFSNSIGHFAVDKSSIAKDKLYTICFKPELCASLAEFKESLQTNFVHTVKRKYLWSLLNCNKCSKSQSSAWLYNNKLLDDSISTALDVLSISFSGPLSVHSQYAWYETQDTKDCIYKERIFTQPEETTAVTGIFGTLQNNQLVDLAQEGDNEQVNSEARLKDLEYPGFICSGHTAHTMEAGRVRRLCHEVSVRVLSESMLNILYTVLETSEKYNRESKQWILFCMGKLVYCSTKALTSIRNKLVSLSAVSINIPTMYVNNEMHTAIISLSSGVLIRRDMNNMVIDTVSARSDIWPDKTCVPLFPQEGTNEAFKFYFSGFFQLTPYIPFDRPPRTLISSVQSIQAVTTPYGAGTASVAPSHTSVPLVSTPLVEELAQSTTHGSECNLSDLIPGENLVVCFANFNDTYEDSIIMNADSAARGLFSYMGYSAHVVKDSEKIPQVGDYANMDSNRWWKSYSRRPATRKLDNNKVHNLGPFKASGRKFIAGGDGRGKVVSTSTTQTGQISVKVLRYSTPVTGDKIATGHGQKGVIKLTPEQDMPWGLDENNECIKFDIVISLSSITNRLTNGQYYEMVSGIEAAREGKRLVISPSTYETKHSETVLYDGKCGSIIERATETGDVPVVVSWGISRVWQMTQLSWDKQHYTHNTAGPSSIVTPTGRTAGGGIRFGEMEAHAIDGSGLIAPYEEIKSRMDLITVDLCMNCDMLAQMCSCESTESYIKVDIPYSMMTFTYANLLISGHLTKFTVKF